MQAIRLQKLIADRGIASRRKAAELVRAGRVRVDGEIVVEPGHRVDLRHQDISVDDVPIPGPGQSKRSIMLHKPRGYICSTRSQSASSHTVYELLSGIKARLVIAGRLDKDSEGLVLLSDDGDLVYRLTHPRFLHRKTYQVLVSGHVSHGTLATLRSRMCIDGYTIRRSRVSILGQEGARTVLEFVLTEGRNRQIRRMCAMVQLRVHRITRVAIGTLQLSELAPGKWRELTPTEQSDINQAHRDPPTC